jgi:hypothetical protein
VLKLVPELGVNLISHNHDLDWGGGGSVIKTICANFFQNWIPE